MHALISYMGGLVCVYRHVVVGDIAKRSGSSYLPYSSIFVALKFREKLQNRISHFNFTN